MSPAAAAALLLAAVAGLLALPRPVRPPPARRDPAGPGGTTTGVVLRGGAALGVLSGVLVGATAGATVLGDGRRLVLAAMAAGVALAGVGALRRRRRAAAAEVRRAALLAACESLTADLRAGQPPVTALERACHDWTELRVVLVAARVDADVPEAMRALASTPGAGDLVAVAAAWQVAHETGSGLAGALEQVVGGLRERRRTARMVAGELAAARATARLLAVLPVGVLALGSSLGGDPVGFLLATTPGLVCLGLGLGLIGLGWLWLDRLAARVLD